MNKAITIAVCSIFILLAPASFAQQKKQVPCTDASYKQFDFWLGHWNVYNNNGKLIGENKVVKMNNACAIQENWSSKTSPSKGTSYNYFNATDKSWNQVWIDNAGSSLVLKGHYKHRKMVLKSKLIQGKKGLYYNQISWFHNSDGTVTQLWEVLDENNTPFNEIFRGTYKKIIK